MIKRLVQKIAQTAYVRSAIEENANLDSLKQKPTPRMVWGLVIIGISYIIGWPMVGLLGMLAVVLNEPLVAIVGGPVTYGLSHLIFMLGAWLAGAEHARTFLRWAARVVVAKLTPDTPSVQTPEDTKSCAAKGPQQ
jgi:hypothetical protein